MRFRISLWLSVVLLHSLSDARAEADPQSSPTPTPTETALVRITSCESITMRIKCDGRAMRFEGSAQVFGSGDCTSSTELDATEIAGDLTLEFLAPLHASSLTIRGSQQVGTRLSVRGEIASSGRVRVSAQNVVVEARIAAADIHMDATQSVSLADQASLRAAGGSVEIRAAGQGSVVVEGPIDVSDHSTAGRGGAIRIMAEGIAVTSSAKLDASGTLRGGSVTVGQTGKRLERGSTASRTHVMPGAAIRADAVTDGNGGEIVLYGGAATAFDGLASARGGSHRGDGGFIDVSSRDQLRITGELHVEAPAGTAGQVLFDPITVVVYPRSIYAVRLLSLPGIPPIPGLAPDTTIYDVGWYLTESDPKLLTNIGLFIVEKYILFSNAFRDAILPFETPVEDVLTDAILGALPDPNVQLFEGLDVDYAADNLIIGLIVKIAEYLTGGTAAPLEILGYFHSVSALALEPLQANISVDSFAGIFFLTALVDPFLVVDDPFGLLRPELDLHAQRADATAKFRTLGPIVSLGGINYQGASLELHAGAPFDNDAANGLVAMAASAIPVAGDIIGNIVEHDRFREAVGEFDLRHLTPKLNLLNDFACCLLGTPNEGSVCLSDLVNGEWCPENYFEDAGLDPYTDLINGGWTEPFGLDCQDWADVGIFWIDQLARFVSDPEGYFRDGYTLLTGPPPAGLGLPVPGFIQDAVDALAYVVANADELIDAVVNEAGALECGDLGVLAQQAVGACNTACTAVSGLCYDACDLVTGSCVVLCNDDLQICLADCGSIRTACFDGCATVYNACIGPCSSARTLCNDGCSAARGGCNATCDTTRNACRAACEIGPFCGAVCQACKNACDGTWSGCRSACTTTYNGCVGACTTAYDGCAAVCGVTRDGCIGGCNLTYEACTFVDCPTDYDLCFENICQVECDNCLVDCGANCAQIPAAVAVIQDACETDWGSSLLALLVENVIPVVGEKLKGAFQIASEVDASVLISTAVQCPPEPVNLPDFAVTLPINPPLLVNGSILRGKGAAKDGGAIILRNGTAGSVAFGGVLEGESVTIQSSTMGLVYHGSYFTYEGLRIGGPIRNARINLPRLLPNVQPLSFGRGDAEIRASTIDLAAAGGIGQITGFGGSGTVHGFVLDLLSAFVPDVLGGARLGTGVDQGTSPMHVIDGVFVPALADLADRNAQFTYVDGGEIPYIKITPPGTDPVTLKALNFETGGIFLESQSDLHLSTASVVFNSAIQLGYFEIAGLPIFPRSFKTEGSQSLVLRTSGSLRLDGVVRNDRGSVRLEGAGGITLGPGASLKATSTITLVAPTSALDAAAQLDIPVPSAITAGSDGGLIAEGSISLGGSLALSIPAGAGHTLSAGSVIAVVSAASLTGSFSNAPSGSRLVTSDKLGSFVVHYGPQSPYAPAQVVLTALRRSGDADGDNDVDGADVVLLSTCLSGPIGVITEGCELLDADLDGRITLADVAALQVAFAGP